MDSSFATITPWTDRLALDVALMLEQSGETIEEICARHNLTTKDILAFNKDRMFLKKVGDLRNEVRDKGLTFRLKAKSQAEELLTTSWHLIHDAETSPAVKADLIKSTVKWAGYEVKESTSVTDSGGGVRITINLGGEAVSTKVIEGDYAQKDP